MKFADRICPFTVHNRFTQPKEVGPLSLNSYSKDHFDLSFEYDRSGEGRKITLELTRDEALELIREIREALNDTM